MCGGSPLIFLLYFVFVLLLFCCRGDYTGEENKIITLVLPSVSLIIVLPVLAG